MWSLKRYRWRQEGVIYTAQTRGHGVSLRLEHKGLTRWILDLKYPVWGLWSSTSGAKVQEALLRRLQCHLAATFGAVSCFNTVGLSGNKTVLNQLLRLERSNIITPGHGAGRVTYGISTKECFSCPKAASEWTVCLINDKERIHWQRAHQQSSWN